MARRCRFAPQPLPAPSPVIKPRRAVQRTSHARRRVFSRFAFAARPSKAFGDLWRPLAAARPAGLHAAACRWRARTTRSRAARATTGRAACARQRSCAAASSGPSCSPGRPFSPNTLPFALWLPLLTATGTGISRVTLSLRQEQLIKGGLWVTAGGKWPVIRLPQDDVFSQAREPRQAAHGLDARHGLVISPLDQKCLLLNPTETALTVGSMWETI